MASLNAARGGAPLAAMLINVFVIAAAQRTRLPAGLGCLAKTPPMGWRSWNTYGNRITQNMMMELRAARTAVPLDALANSRSATLVTARLASTRAGRAAAPA